MMWQRDLKHPGWMYLKAILFGLCIILSGWSIFLQVPRWSTLFLLLVMVWCSARLYYFFFYVIERYIAPDGEYKYAGLLSAFQYLLRGKRADVDDADQGNH